MLPDEERHMAHDGVLEGAGTPVPGRTDNSPALPYAKAFIVQFGAETDAQRGHVTGRIEHLQTGRRSRFASVDELLAWITAMLASVPTSRDDG
jgi:hypothetical protein